MLRHKYLRTFILICLAVFLFSVSGVYALQNPEYTIKVGQTNEATEESIFHLIATKFIELVETYSDGRIECEYYPSFQLGGEQEQVRNLQLGLQEVTIPSFSNLSPYAPSTYFISLPYMFDSVEQGRAVMDKMLPMVNEWTIEEAGIRILAFQDAGFRVLTNSKKPVETIEDLQGLKIRIPQNPIWVETFKSWGIDPIPLDWSETFNAMQQKVVDGQENPYNVPAALGFYEVQKYVTEINAIYQTSATLISEKFFQSLPSDLQEVMLKVGKETQEYEWWLADNTIEKDKQTLRDNGMILLGEPKDMEKWVERARATWPEFYDLIGDGDEERGKEIVETVKQYKAEFDASQ